MIPTNVSCLRAECEGQSAAAPLPRAGDEYATQEAKQTDTAEAFKCLNQSHSHGHSLPFTYS